MCARGFGNTSELSALFCCFPRDSRCCSVPECRGPLPRRLRNCRGVARSISVDKNYAVRANRHAEGEIGILIDSFNHMLSQIEIRELRARRPRNCSARARNVTLSRPAAPTTVCGTGNSRPAKSIFRRAGIRCSGPDQDRWSDPEEWFSLIHPADRDRVKAEIAAHRAGATAGIRERIPHAPQERQLYLGPEPGDRRQE
jgi:hypothetical protein